MNLRFLAANSRNAWRHAPQTSDFVKRLLWHYSQRYDAPATFEIGFRYPAPVGRLNLLVRSNEGADAFVLGEIFEQGCYDLQLPEQPETVLDLGSNAGFSAIFFARQYPNAKVACVEPVETNLAVLRRNLEINKVHAAVIAAAVAPFDGALGIQMHRKDYGHKVVEIDRETESPKVAAISVPTIMERLGWDGIGLAKVDIEGYEKQLFSTNREWLHHTQSLCIECHDDFGENDLGEIAREFGFLPPRQQKGIWFLTRRTS